MYLLFHIRFAQFFDMLKKKIFLFKLRFTPCKAEEPLRGMELQEKEAQKIKAYWKSFKKELTVKWCLLILDLKPLRS